MKRVRVSHETTRGAWATDMGQGVEQWVPAGVYDLITPPIEYRDAECLSLFPADRPHGNSCFYVAEEVAAKLPAAR